MKVEITWEVTEVHRMVYDLGEGDNANLEAFVSEELDSEFLAAWEGNDSYASTVDRSVLYVGELADQSIEARA